MQLSKESNFVGERIAYQHLSFFSKTDKAYLGLDENLRQFYAYPPNLASFGDVMEKRKQFPTNRETLSEVIHRQYQTIHAEKQGQELANLILQPNTYTVTTAHQPSLLLGPLYYVYKILHAVLLSKHLKEAYPECNFVPTFVIGGEDHDFEEVNHTFLYNKKIEWNSDQQGSVGLFNTKGLDEIVAQIQELFPSNQNSEQLISILKKSYLHQNRYFEASQSLIQQLFGHLGLLVLHLYEDDLKRNFKDILKDEIVHQHSKKLVQQTVDKLESLGFKNQAHVRDINLFYITEQSRERIVEEDGVYKILNTNIQFSQEEILADIDLHPNRYSPNVVLRPMYQEFVLPNLAYIGGGGEIAYWLERKKQFEFFGVPYPVLIRRQSALIFDKDIIKKLQKLGIDKKELFQPIDTIVKEYIFQKFGENLTLQSSKEAIQNIYTEISQLAEKIDPTLRQSVLADATKQIANIESWESRLIRTLKQKQETSVNQIRNLHQRLFPNGGLQERQDNFMPYFAKYGFDFFQILLTHFKPFDSEFLVLTEHEES